MKVKPMEVIVIQVTMSARKTVNAIMVRHPVKKVSKDINRATAARKMQRKLSAATKVIEAKLQILVTV